MFYTNTFACNSAKFYGPLATTDAGNVSFMWIRICDQNVYASFIHVQYFTLFFMGCLLKMFFHSKFVHFTFCK